MAIKFTENLQRKIQEAAAELLHNHENDSVDIPESCGLRLVRESSVVGQELLKKEDTILAIYANEEEKQNFLVCRI
ncbi:MAG: hypothetical protein MUD00_03030 [Candidatus Pacebacteria bacterium]|jgi:hypothetical protein|nr:hypothetical protein [Candidatus Paceibacterota bacterium]